MMQPTMTNIKIVLAEGDETLRFPTALCCAVMEGCVLVMEADKTITHFPLQRVKRISYQLPVESPGDLTAMSLPKEWPGR
jgi:hypothetical protein